MNIKKEDAKKFIKKIIRENLSKKLDEDINGKTYPLDKIVSAVVNDRGITDVNKAKSIITYAYKHLWNKDPEPGLIDSAIKRHLSKK